MYNYSCRSIVHCSLYSIIVHCIREVEGHGVPAEVVEGHEHEAAIGVVGAPGVFHDEVAGAVVALDKADDGHAVVVGGRA